jgi:autotransporter-associated beta strand protein
MDVSSITVTGHSSPPVPPTITANPVSVSVPIGGSVPFNVSATGVSLTYQWHRGGTNLLDSSNISGVTSSTLIISPVTANDVSSSYSVTVTGAGGLSANSTTAALSTRSAVNLVWGAGTSSLWDLTNTADWFSGLNTVVFNYGDNVTFDDTAAVNSAIFKINLSYNFLSAGTVTVNNSTGNDYTFQSGGSIAGNANLVYTGSGLLVINNANSYSGGTLVSNSSAHLELGTWGALGTGPVTFAQAGALLETFVAGSASSGIKGELIVADDFTYQPDVDGSFAGVFLGDLSGTAGKTMTINPSVTTNGARIRFYGGNTVMNANIAINGLTTSPASAAYTGTTIAPYSDLGSQTYNGVISGPGGIIERGGGGLTILNAQNTYTGGTTPTTGTIAFGADSTGTPGSVTSGPIGTGALFVAAELPNTSGTGTIEAFGAAHTVGNQVEYISITNNQTLQVGGTNPLTLSGPIFLHGQDLQAGSTNRTFSITNTALTTFSGVISDNGSAYGLIKSGNGTLALTAPETYTGPTTSSGGRLLINGSTAAASSVTAATNGSIGGTGTIAGNVSIAQGGTLAPGGDAAIGTLNVTGNLANNGNISVRVNRAGSLCDEANVTGTLTSSGSGTVTVTNLGATLQVGDTFHVFNKLAGGAGSLNVTGAGALWTNKLAIDGTIAVTLVVATTPGPLNFSNANGSLTLSWPANYQSWILKSNSTGLASTNWFPVANSGNVTSMTIPVQPNRSNVFYRLVAP